MLWHDHDLVISKTLRLVFYKFVQNGHNLQGHLLLRVTVLYMLLGMLTKFAKSNC
jgi:hypothetical protein